MDDYYYDHPSLLLLLMMLNSMTLTPPPSRGGPMSLNQLGTERGGAGKFGSNCNAKVPAFWWWNWVEEESKAKSKVQQTALKVRFLFGRPAAPKWILIPS